MKIPWWVLVIAGVLILLILQYDGSNNGPNISPPNQKTKDSLENTKPGFDATMDTMKLRAAKETVEVIRLVNASNESTRRANEHARRADSLAKLGNTWHEAYNAKSDEVVDLRVALVQKDSAWRDERASRILYQGLYANDTLRRHAIEKLNAGLVADIAKLERPCRIVGPIPCPNRRTSAIGGAVLDRVVTVLIGRN